jgi:hypothetical protein
MNKVNLPDIEYNSQRVDINIAEYGRNIQKMLAHVAEIEDKFRHYGHHIQLLIKKAKEMPEGPKKVGMINTIASYMKLAYKTWNRENFVSDESIKNDLATISKGTLYVEDGSSIDTFGQPTNNSNARRRPMGKSYGSNDYGRNRSNYPQNANKNKSRPRFSNPVAPGKRKPNI